MESFSLLLYTFLLRPYVFVFLLIYFLGCSLHLGVKRAVFFVIIGYVIAWLSEFCSIHSGIPYGHYYYIEQTRGKEIWVLGVPFMDSLSYVFLAYASYSLALMMASPILMNGRAPYPLETRKIRSSFYARALGAIFFVYLDIIIDPVALQGSKWFLGQIYGYPERGAYFGVPISNFGGWLVVGFLMIYTLQWIDSYLDKKSAKDYTGYFYPWRFIVGPALYISVLIFNICVTFAIGDYQLGWTGVFIALLPIVLFVTIMKLKKTNQDIAYAVQAHMADFPSAVVPGSHGKPISHNARS